MLYVCCVIQAYADVVFALCDTGLCSCCMYVV